MYCHFESVDFSEVVCVHNANTLIKWFDYNELIIFEVVQCFLVLQC